MYFSSINGQPVNAEALVVSIWDPGFQRGDGVFEVIRVIGDGHLRAVDLHLDRLERSALAIACPLPDRLDIKDWLSVAAQAGGEGCVRLMATKGGKTIDGSRVPSLVYILWQPLPSWPATFTLQPQPAPWHPAGRHGWPAIKWLSYGPNVHATRMAADAGFTDALLLADDDNNNNTTDLEQMRVLDGPNFAVGWIKDSTIYFPDWERNGLLQSTSQVLVTRAAKEQLGLEVEEGVYKLEDLLAADEVFVLSSTRGVIPVEQVGTKLVPVGDVARKLGAALDQLALTA